MPHMQIIVDGDTVYDDVIDDWMAPPKPDRIPAAVRAQANPNAKPAPFMKALMLAMIGNALANGALRDPRLQPLNVQLTKRSTGWTVSVDIPPPADHLPAGHQADHVQYDEARQPKELEA